MTRHYKEQELQIAVAHYFRRIEALTRSFTFTHCPNGGKRTKREAALFKAMGTRAGTPDLLFIGPNARTVWVEMKHGKTPTSPAQKEFHSDLEKLGHAVHVVSAESKDEAIDKVGVILGHHGIIPQQMKGTA